MICFIGLLTAHIVGAWLTTRMGVGRSLPRQLDMVAVARQAFGPVLSSLRLSGEQIDGQSLAELEASLTKVNELIANPASFGGPIRLKLSANAGAVITQNTAEAHLEIGPLPMLLECKQAILDRLAELRPQQQYEDIRDVVSEKVDDASLRAVLLSALEEEREKQQATTEQLREEMAQVRRAEVEAAEAQARIKIEIQERKSRIYRQFLERESVATIIGAVLLLALATVLVVAMFIRLPVPELISSSFLLILGYFFGQTTGRRRATNDEGDDVG
ncbi:hypothetical protein AB0M43_36605 [Longispora sp. NPDC051575]|uniref:hypothetical protein n=1 Tax=Longispora sp. NPDC051575 TaxID=3154943 RepID=UPI0034272C50